MCTAVDLTVLGCIPEGREMTSDEQCLRSPTGEILYGLSGTETAQLSRYGDFEQCTQEEFHRASDTMNFCPPDDSTGLEREALSLVTEYCTDYPCWKVEPSYQDVCVDEYLDILDPCPGVAGQPECAGIVGCGQDAQYSDTERTYTVREADCGDGQENVVVDYLTGLTWQQTSILEKSGEGYFWQDGFDYCDQLDFDCETDWRLPDYYELNSIMIYRSDETPFENLFGWSSSRLLNSPNQAWYVFPSATGFDPIEDGPGESAASFNVRCVRGKPRGDDGEARFYNASVPVVLDKATGLVWQKQYISEKTWIDALAYCESLTISGHEQWRLPSITELRSLVNIELEEPATAFPDMPSKYFWSSTVMPFAEDWDDRNEFEILGIDFEIGDVNSSDGDNTEQSVRCVSNLKSWESR